MSDVDITGYTLSLLFTVAICLIEYRIVWWLLKKYGNRLLSYINRHSESWWARCVFRLPPHNKGHYANDNDTNNEKGNNPRVVTNPSTRHLDCLPNDIQDGENHRNCDDNPNDNEEPHNIAGHEQTIQASNEAVNQTRTEP